MLLEATDQLVLGACRQGLELTLHLEVEQNPKELQEDLSGDRRAKGPEAGNQ